MTKDLLTFRTTDKEFEEIVTTALEKDKEVLVLNRPANSAGEKHWFLFHSWTELDEIVKTAKVKDAFSVFPATLLSLRGKADAELEKQALALLEKYGEIIMWVASSDGPELKVGWGADEDEIEYIKEFFEKFTGQQVLLGRYPDFELEIVGAYVPDEDGVIRPGAY